MRFITYTPATRCSSPSMLAANPFAMLEAEMNRIFGHAASASAAANGKTEKSEANASDKAEAAPAEQVAPEAWIHVEINEDTKAYQLQAALPGVRKEDISIAVLDGELTLKATRAWKNGEATQTQAYGRSITLSEDIDVEAISATHDNGLLTISLPKREQAKPRSIAVN